MSAAVGGSGTGVNLPPGGGKNTAGDGDPTLDPAGPEGTGGAGTLDASNVSDLTSILDDLSDLQKLLSGLVTSSDDAGGSPAPPGAPSLDKPDCDMSPTSLGLSLSFTVNQLNVLQNKAAFAEIQFTDKQRQEAHQKAIDQIEKIAKKLRAAAKKKKALGALGVLAKVFVAIAAVALTVLTGGAGSLLAGAMLAYTLADTVMTVAGKFNESRGGMSLDINSLLSKGFTAAAKAAGKSDEEAEKIGQWTAFAVQMAVAIAMVAGGIYQATKGAGKALVELTDIQKKALEITQLSAQLLNAATTMSQGGVTMAKAFDDRDSARARATQVEMQGFIEKLKSVIDGLVSDIKDGNNSYSNIVKDTSALIESAHEGTMQTISVTV